jgi:signal transduction histidine kinase
MRSEMRGDDWVIAVSDTGRGIRREEMDRVFEPFARGVSDDRGFGVGLAVARMLVNMHGGAIRVQSAGIGRGSTFRVELPQARRRSTLASAISVDAGSPHIALQSFI